MHGVVALNTAMTCSLWPLLLADPGRPQEEGGRGGGAAAGALGERAQQLRDPQRQREGGGGALDRGAPRQLPDRRQRRRPRRAVRLCVAWSASAELPLGTSRKLRRRSHRTLRQSRIWRRHWTGCQFDPMNTSFATVDVVRTLRLRCSGADAAVPSYCDHDALAGWQPRGSFRRIRSGAGGFMRCWRSSGPWGWTVKPAPPISSGVPLGWLLDGLWVQNACL